MERSKDHEGSAQAVGYAPLEPPVLATAQRFRSLLLVADSPETGVVARRTAREIMHDWGQPSLSEDVALCVSELVGNAVLHATPDGSTTAFGGVQHITVAFRAWPKWLFVEVADEDSTPPMLPVGEPVEHALSDLSSDELLQDSGRGLFLVQSLADAVWWAPRDVGGKSVFCQFNLDSDPYGAAESRAVLEDSGMATGSRALLMAWGPDGHPWDGLGPWRGSGAVDGLPAPGAPLSLPGGCPNS